MHMDTQRCTQRPKQRTHTHTHTPVFQQGKQNRRDKGKNGKWNKEYKSADNSKHTQIHTKTQEHLSV